MDWLVVLIQFIEYNKCTVMKETVTISVVLTLNNSKKILKLKKL